MNEWPPNSDSLPAPPPDEGDNKRAGFTEKTDSSLVPPPSGPLLSNSSQTVPEQVGSDKSFSRSVIENHRDTGDIDRSSDESESANPQLSRIGLLVAGAGAVVALVAVGVLVGLKLSSEDLPEVQSVVRMVEDPPITGTQVLSAQTGIPPTIPIQPGPVSEQAPEPVAAVAAAVAPAVVRIDTGVGTGSGIIYDETGLLVTNAHVVGDISEVTVQFADGIRADAMVIGRDPAVDVAVVKIIGEVDFEIAVFAPTSTVEVGQLAVAIGSPFGLENSVTAGIISAVNRAVNSTNVFDGTPTVVEMVQTDAPINPGNSGGALADRQGRIVGMNTSIRTDGTVQGNLGVGFAIPSDTVLLVANRIVAGEPLDNGFLGVSGLDPADGQPGALISDVVTGSPAELGGLLIGDLVTSVDGAPVLGISELAAKVRLSSPGTVVTIVVEREGEPVKLTITLGKLGQG